MRHVLIVAYYFPPLGGIGSVRMTRFARLLPEYGWRVTVLAPSGGGYFLDPSLSFPEEHVVRSRSFELSRTAKKVLRTGGTDTEPAHPTGLRRALRTAAREVLYFPDAAVGWYPGAVRAGRMAMRTQSFDAILSSAYPVTAHLIARRLQRVSGIPWVAEYRDPFAEGVNVEGVNRRRAQRLEKSIALESSAMVMTSPSWARAESERWNRCVSVITNGCDDAIATSPPDRDRLVLAHLGTLYPAWQDLTGISQAIRNLAETGRPGVDRVRFIGSPQAEVRKQLEIQGLGPLMEITGLLPRPEATQRLAEADVLLLAGPKDERLSLRGWIPAKVFDYLATDLPIIYVGNRDCDVAALLSRHQGTYLLDVHDVDGIMEALRASRGQRYARNLSELAPRALTAKLASTLDACL